jgi:shikimate dehydrogenase
MELTLRAALIGQPVAHSLSPTLHAAAGLACGIPVEYGLVDASPEELPRALARLVGRGVYGINLTAPHKVAVRPLCAELSAVAARVGAVNTLLVAPDGALHGHNTDVEGFIRAAQPQPADRVLLLGAGGAARAVLEGLRATGVTEVTVCNRHVHKAEALLADFDLGADARALHAAEHQLAGVSLVVNALPRALSGWVSALPWSRVPADGRVFDLSYGTAAAPVVGAVRRAGRAAADGLEMLAWQGIAAFELWTGRAPPPEPVLRALRAAAPLDSRAD